ncbi:MAG TPA: branched-chain amino acid ABC transporter permease [Methylomirabilota bacterium]|nr:branched-chain amino acid ABC transporter permease [Methylomirabilota bacterium]
MGANAASRPRAPWWFAVGIVLIAAILAPYYLVTDISDQIDISIIFVLALLALSMSFLWGYAGILSFGQTAFFGLGGYAYTVLALNLHETTFSFFAAIALTMLFAAVLGYFMIYGRISDIYLSVITLVVTLIFEKAIKSTSGDQYVIGSVRLNGQNGIPTVPSLRIPWSGTELSFDGVFILDAVLLILVYAGLRLLLTTTFGRVLVGIRENTRRIELLGYDSRRYKLGAFVISGGIAALAGVLYGVWNNFVAPEMFGLKRAAEVIVWVIVGGKSTLVGPIVGTAIVQYLQNKLGTQSVGEWLPLILGFVLILVVLLFRNGLLPGLVGGIGWAWRQVRRVA